MTGNKTSLSASGKRLIQAVTLAALGALCFAAAGCPAQTSEKKATEGRLTLELPQDDAPQPLTEAPRDLIISISADGTTAVAGKALSREELVEMLSRVAKDQPQRGVLIRADERTRVERLSDVLELVQKAGINEAKIGYLTRADRSEGGE